MAKRDEPKSNADAAQPAGPAAVPGPRSLNEELHAVHAVSWRAGAEEPGPAPVLGGQAEGHGGWPRLDPLRKHLEPDPRKPRKLNALREAVDTAPGELAFLELIGQPDHLPLPETSEPGHLPTRPDDEIDTMVRIVRFLFQAARLRSEADLRKIDGVFKAIFGCEPRTWRANTVGDHVEGWAIQTFWRKELRAGERTPARPGDDDTQTVERIRRIVEEKWGNDPGPPERWASQSALALNDLMRKLGDSAAASLAFSAFEDAQDTETIEPSRQTLADNWAVTVTPRPERWTLSQTAAVYRLLVTLGVFGAPVATIEPQKVFEALKSYNFKAVLKERAAYRKALAAAYAAGGEVDEAAVMEKVKAEQERARRKPGPGSPNADQVVAKILALAGFDSMNAIRRMRSRENARRAGEEEKRKRKRKKPSTARRRPKVSLLKS